MASPFPFKIALHDTEPVIDGVQYPMFMQEGNVRRIPEMEIRDDDVWLISYPKTGTHWIKTILYQLYNHNTPEGRGEKEAPDANDYIPFVEFPHFPSGGLELDRFIQMPKTERRLIATHLQPKCFSKQFLEKKPKAIHIMRNPKDTAVSFFNFVRDMPVLQTRENWDSFLDEFISGDVPFGSYADFLNLWWDVSQKTNILNLTYEDLKKDLKGGVMKIAAFLEVELSEEEAATIAERCTFDAMKAKAEEKSKHMAKAVFRKGVAGGWKKHFTVAQSEKFDAFFDEEFKNLSFKFQYE